MSSLLSFLLTIYNIFTRLIIKNMKKNKIYSLGFMGYLSHDPAACLMCSDEDGNIKYIHFEEGMLSRKKKSYQLLKKVKHQQHLCLRLNVNNLMETLLVL